MPMKWFDRRENTFGSLSHALSHSCEVISELVTTHIFVVAKIVSSIVSCLILSFVYEWRLALVTIGFFPLLMLSSLIKMKFVEKITK
jgi:ABC-type multidrug transport system fused ATPase/permease subunit